MQSEIEIINLALSCISDGNFVQSLDEDSPEAVQAKMHYDPTLQAVLSDHAWDFARRIQRLALMAHDQGLSAWAFHYGYPVDAVQIRRVFSVGNANKSVPFATGRSEDGVQRIIMTNHQTAAAEYTLAKVAPGTMPPLFVKAFSWRLAAEIALSRAQREQANYAMQVYQAQLEEAKLRDARESGPLSRTDGNWMKSRYPVPAAYQQPAGGE